MQYGLLVARDLLSILFVINIMIGVLAVLTYWGDRKDARLKHRFFSGAEPDAAVYYLFGMVLFFAAVGFAAIVVMAQQLCCKDEECFRHCWNDDCCCCCCCAPAERGGYYFLCWGYVGSGD